MGLLSLVLIGIAIYFIFLAKKAKAAAEDAAPTALDMLKEKFVNGEIDEAEYKAKKDVITK